MPKKMYQNRKVSHVAHAQKDRQTDTKVNTEDILSGFQDIFLDPMPDASNMIIWINVWLDFPNLCITFWKDYHDQQINMCVFIFSAFLEFDTYQASKCFNREHRQQGSTFLK